MSLTNISQIIQSIGSRWREQRGEHSLAQITKRGERWINRTTSVSVVSIDIDGALHHLAVVSSDKGMSTHQLVHSQPLAEAWKDWER